jgi:hypothetical protein
MDDLLATLQGHEQHAVKLLKLTLDEYNSPDGTGLFSGAARYAVLEARVSLTAMQAHTLISWWSLLCRKLLWPLPSVAIDGKLLDLLQVKPAADYTAMDVLRCLAYQTAGVVMVARHWHTTEKAARIAETKAGKKERS